MSKKSNYWDDFGTNLPKNMGWLEFSNTLPKVGDVIDIKSYFSTQLKKQIVSSMNGDIVYTVSFKGGSSTVWCLEKSYRMQWRHSV